MSKWEKPGAARVEHAAARLIGAPGEGKQIDARRASTWGKAPGDEWATHNYMGGEPHAERRKDESGSLNPH